MARLSSLAKLVLVASTTSLILIGSSLAEDMPIKVTKKLVLGPGGGSVIIVTSLVDRVQIKTVIANRGNCIDVTARNIVHPTDVIKFGQGLVYEFECDAIEIAVETDIDNYLFSWSD